MTRLSQGNLKENDKKELKLKHHLKKSEIPISKVCKGSLVQCIIYHISS